MKYHYTLYDFFDDNTDNGIVRAFKEKLTDGQELKQDGVTYQVDQCDYWGPDNPMGKEPFGTAVFRMTRYLIPDTSTQFIHKCPAKKKAMEKMDNDDVVKLQEQHGKVGAEKRIKAWKQGRTKMQSYNRLELRCPLCKCIFYKKNNQVPDSVTVDGVMGKKELRKTL